MSLHKVVYVNKEDKIVGSGSIAQAYKAGHVLRIVRIFLINKSGDILLQRRSKSATSSLKWDQSAGGHVDEGETYLEAAKRELFEEMGVKGVKLIKIAKFYTEDRYFNFLRQRFNMLYYGTYDGKVTIDNNEVADYIWISPTDLTQWILNNPSEFTEGFLISYKKMLAANIF